MEPSYSRVQRVVRGKRQAIERRVYEAAFQGWNANTVGLLTRSSDTDATSSECKAEGSSGKKHAPLKVSVFRIGAVCGCESLK